MGDVGPKREPYGSSYEPPAEHSSDPDRPTALPAAVRVRGARAVSAATICLAWSGCGRTASRSRHHYPMATACAPSRASLLTGQYPSLHGVTQTDGLAKAADGPTCSGSRRTPCRRLATGSALAATAPTSRASGTPRTRISTPRTATGYLLSIDDDGKPIEENIEKYLEADLLDDYGFSEWVGPEPHGLGKHNMGTVKDPFTADETIDAAQAPRRRRRRPAVAVGLLVPEPARRLVLRRRRAARRGCATTPRRSRTSRSRRRTTRTCRPSPPASRASSTSGPRSRRRSRGSRRT